MGDWEALYPNLDASHLPYSWLQPSSSQDDSLADWSFQQTPSINANDYWSGSVGNCYGWFAPTKHLFYHYQTRSTNYRYIQADVTTREDKRLRLGIISSPDSPYLSRLGCIERLVGQLGNGVGNGDWFVSDWLVNFRWEVGNNVVIGWRGHVWCQSSCRRYWTISFWRLSHAPGFSRYSCGPSHNFGFMIWGLDQRPCDRLDRLELSRPSSLREGTAEAPYCAMMKLKLYQKDQFMDVSSRPCRLLHLIFQLRIIALSKLVRPRVIARTVSLDLWFYHRGLDWLLVRLDLKGWHWSMMSCRIALSDSILLWDDIERGSERW